MRQVPDDCGRRDAMTTSIALSREDKPVLIQRRGKLSVSSASHGRQCREYWRKICVSGALRNAEQLSSRRRTNSLDCDVLDSFCENTRQVSSTLLCLQTRKYSQLLARQILRTTGVWAWRGSNFGFLHWVASSPSQHTRTVIFRAFPFSAPPLSLPTFFSYFSLFSFQPPLPFPKEVNKKRSYRGQNALSEIKTHECNNDNEHILYLSVSQSPLAGRIMLSTCPFVCYQLVNVILRKRINRF